MPFRWMLFSASCQPSSSTCTYRLKKSATGFSSRCRLYSSMFYTAVVTVHVHSMFAQQFVLCVACSVGYQSDHSILSMMQEVLLP